MSVLVGTQEVLKLHNKEPGKARPANRDQSAVEGCPRSLRLHRRIAPDNARALTGLATFRVVGKPEVIQMVAMLPGAVFGGPDSCPRL